jgi:hypothetical protein
MLSNLSKSLEANVKASFNLHSGLAVALIAVVLLGAQVWVLSSELRAVQDRTNGELAAYEKSLNEVQAGVMNAKDTAPGLGEFMTTIQLHMGKLWFAAKASNWDLARYELGELKETMESARNLHQVKNGVNIGAVLDSVIQTEVAELGATIKSKDHEAFLKSYDETLSACNGCHEESDHRFIHVIRPSAPPVTNQRWEPPAAR